MLVEFSVKNFMCIKDEIKFTMQAEKTKNEIEENITQSNMNGRNLKSAAILGNSSSGKTNFIRAFTASIIMIRKSNLRNINEPLIEMVPFKFDKNMVNKPCEFKFVFIKNNVKYMYGFSADINKVHTECLYQYLSDTPMLIFERDNSNHYKFTASEQEKLKNFAVQNAENKLFLFTATAGGYEKTVDAYRWFLEDIDTFTDYMEARDISFNKFENDREDILKNFTINLLKEADSSIKDYNFDVKEMNTNNVVSLNKIKNPNENIVQKQVRISILHEVKKLDGGIENYELDLSEESLGLQSLFLFSPVLKDTFERGKTLLIDDADKNLHPSLVKFIVKMFHNSELNKNNAQLIFSTKNKDLLSLDIFRKDQIWTTEKEAKSGITKLNRYI